MQWHLAQLMHVLARTQQWYVGFVLSDFVSSTCFYTALLCYPKICMLNPPPPASLSFFVLSIEPNFNLLSSISHYLLPVQIGVGMCMEGIEHNPVVYELMSEMAFRSDPLHLEVNKYSYFTNQSKLSCIFLHRKHTMIHPSYKRNLSYVPLSCSIPLITA